MVLIVLFFIFLISKIKVHNLMFFTINSKTYSKFWTKDYESQTTVSFNFFLFLLYL